MKVLFLTRTFPPITGGMENQNYELSRWLPRAGVALTTVANHRGKRFLPLFLPWQWRGLLSLLLPWLQKLNLVSHRQ